MLNKVGMLIKAIKVILKYPPASSGFAFEVESAGRRLLCGVFLLSLGGRVPSVFGMASLVWHLSVNGFHT